MWNLEHQQSFNHCSFEYKQSSRKWRHPSKIQVLLKFLSPENFQYLNCQLPRNVPFMGLHSKLTQGKNQHTYVGVWTYVRYILKRISSNCLKWQLSGGSDTNWGKCLATNFKWHFTKWDVHRELWVCQHIPGNLSLHTQAALCVPRKITWETLFFQFWLILGFFTSRKSMVKAEL